MLVLDGVQDPGNVGTLLRTAAAFRWSAIALLPGCCDPFNPKAVRASRGACFRMPLWRLASWAQAQALCSGISVTCLAADAGGDDTGRVLERAAAGGGDVGGDRLWLALGAEGQGLSEGAMQACTRVAIPGAGASLRWHPAPACLVHGIDIASHRIVCCLSLATSKQTAWSP